MRIFKIFRAALLVCFLWILPTFGLYQSQPKIFVENGHLIFESARDRNISIRLVGDAYFMVNDIEVLNFIQSMKSRNSMNVPTDSSHTSDEQISDLLNHVLGPNGLLERVSRMENSTSQQPIIGLPSLRRRLRLLTQQVNALDRKLHENNCTANPCKNGATCIDLFDDFHCICPTNWQGKTCELDVDECYEFAGTDLGCQNNALCVNAPGTYRCECTSGWKGIHCRQREVDCSTSPPGELCGNGICVPKNDAFGYACICNQGWKSNNETPACTVDIDECAQLTHRCVNSCINLPGSYMCGPCPAGYTGNGMICTDINECEVNNGGCSMAPRVRCINTQGSYHCANCPIGWSGDGRVCNTDSASCSTYGICHPQATCSYVSNSVICTCPPGMTGSGYGPSGCSSIGADPCNPNQCKNGGTCRPHGSSYICICPPGYEQANCEKRDACQSNPCKNQGLCFPTLTSFRCLCKPGFKGTTCDEDRTICQSILTETSGTIRYPINGSTYPPNDQCAWVIRTNDDKVLNVTFTKFDVEPHRDCHKDFLQIHDGRSAGADLIARFCGNTLPKGGNIISSHNLLYFWFKSDASIQKEGFAFTWQSIDPICGGKVSFESHGVIQSPGYPGKSPPNRNCEWILEARPDKRIFLTFNHVQLSPTQNCTGDYLKVYDGENKNEELDRFCESTTPGPIESISNTIVVHFHTDETNFDSSFQLHFSALEGIHFCGGLFMATEGVFESPRIGDFGNYNYTCKYLIRTDPTTRIKLDFPDFNLGFFGSCSVRSVQIFDGKSEDDPLIAEYCNNIAPENIESSSNYLLVKYHFMGQQMNARYGFSGRYKIGCGGVYKNSSGTIVSPLYPKPYVSDLHCIYTIEAPEGYVISIKVVDFELKERWWNYGECGPGEDNLAVYSPQISNSSLLGRYCETFSDIISKYNRMVLEFSTNSEINFKGFKIQYQMEEIGCGAVKTENNGTIRFESDTQRGTKTECEWILLAPQTYHIYVQFEKFNIGGSPKCENRFLKIHAEDITTEKHMGTFCGSDSPGASYYAVHVLKISFYAESLNPGEGFLFNYRFIDMLTDCYAEYRTPAGVIHSPGWPGEYFDNSNCTWIIYAPMGQQIELEVKNFSLESYTNCEFDSLEIRDGRTKDSPQIGKYCGEDIPKRIISYTNTLYLHFIADDVLTHSGFEIEWNVASQSCGGDLSSHKGFIVPPHYPETINEGMQCDWSLNVNYGSTIKMDVTIPNDDGSNCDMSFLTIFDGPTAMYNEIKPNCSTDSIRTFKTTQSSALVRYRTVSDDANSFQLTYESNCRTILTDPRGVIESPNFPNNYPNNLNCEWKILGKKGNKISVAFSHVDLELTHSQCHYDFLKVLDAQDGVIRETHNICTLPENIITSTGDTVAVRFTSDFANVATGFRLDYAIKGCSNYFTAYRGIFSSPDPPYSLDRYCEWTINVGYGNVVELIIFDMSMETSNKDCSKNALVISNDKAGNNTLLKVCQTEKGNRVVTSSGHIMYVKFYTDSVRERKFVKASYAAKHSTCGGRYKTANGNIHSQNYPQKYPKNLYCEWILSAGDHHTLDLSFNSFNLGNSTNCEKNYVELYDGRTKAPNRLLLRHCGPTLPASNFLQSVQHEVLVIFKSSNDTEPGPGFELHYKRNCGKDVVDKTSGYFDKGVNDNNCIWTIKSSNSSTHVTLQFEHLQCSCRTGSETDCETQKGIQVFDGDSTQAPLKNSFCTHHPHAIISNGQSLTIKAVNGEFRAFYSLYENACGGKLTSLRGKFASPRYPNSYPTSIECVWEIKAAEGNYIEISFDTFDIPKSKYCSEDYVEVREKSENGKFLGSGTFCGNEIPPQLIGFESIWIKFRSDDDQTADGFLATWSYAHANEITGMEGKIKSPPIEGVRNDDENYSWRIIVPRGNLIVFAFQEYVDGLKLYNGYDETAIEVDIEVDSGEIISSTNVAYIISENSILAQFLIKWKAVPKNATNQISPADNTTCSNSTVVIPVNEYVNISSPGYPFGYANDLHCEWTLKTDDPATHVLIRVLEVDLEYSADDGCFYDYLKIYSSENFMTWQKEDEICNIPHQPWPIKFIRGKPFAKLVFHTDVSNNKTGFAARVTTECGSELTEPNGIIRGIVASTKIGYHLRNCTWSIRVKPGKRIKFTFNSMEVPTSEDPNICDGYVSLRNGLDEEAPYLGIGRFCKGKNLTVPETSTNRAFVRAFVSHIYDMRWELEYKSISDKCGDNIQLTNERNSTSFTTPNYPNIPNPNTECIWTILAPPGESLELTFPEKFDLHPEWRCKHEFIEVKDGTTEVAREIRRFCMKPTIIRSPGSALYIRYVTELPEPRNGFKALVTLAKCGGRYSAQFSNIKSENYPALGGYPSNSVCEYRISSSPNTRINVTLVDIHLPVLQNRNESDHLSFYIVNEAENNTLLEVATIYGDNVRPFIEIESNQALIRFFSYKPNAEYRGFKLAYRYVPGLCGKRVTAESGQIIVPNLRARLLCLWIISVPKGRRVRLDLLEYSSNPSSNNTDYKFTFSNDLLKLSVIAKIENLENMKAISSSDNVMYMRLFKENKNSLLTAKFEFTSFESSYCTQDTSEDAGLITAPVTFESYMCRTKFILSPRQTLGLFIEDFLVHNSTKDDRLYLSITTQNYAPMRFLENTTNEIVAIAGPSVGLQIMQTDTWQIKSLRINYKINDCGGNFLIQGNSIITKPNITSAGKIDCAWVIQSRLNYNLTGSFNLNPNCDKEYVALYRRPAFDDSRLGKICGNNTSFHINNTDKTYIHYHAEEVNPTSIFEIHTTPATHCGGSFSNEYGSFPNIEFNSEDYKNNLECVWDIQNKFGYSTEIAFSGRYYIEESDNCTKDYLLIRLYNDSSWTNLPRYCGRHVPDSINVTYTKMQIIFRSDDSNTGDGFTMTLRNHCGGIYTVTDTPKTVFMSDYDTYAQNCNFTLLATSNEIIKVTFIDLDLDTSAWCPKSRMTVFKADRYDKNDMVEVGSYCKSDSIKSVKSLHKIILLVNMTSTAGAFFRFEFQLDTCGGMITNSTEIQSMQHENEPNTYATDMNCVWNITAPNNYGIAISFKKFDFHGLYECSDNVRIYSGSEVSNANLKRELCGTYKKEKPIIKIQENKAIVIAKSSSYQSIGEGFSALIKFTQLCDEEILLTDQNSTYHFDRFSGHYDNDLDCHYIFNAPDGYYLQIDFNSFNLTSCSESNQCNCDFVELRDGGVNSTAVLGKFCGQESPPRILSSKRALFVRFVTDSELSGKGFDASIRIVPSPCGINIINLEPNKEIIIKSPNFGQLYPANVVCHWTVNSNASVEIHFEKFDLEEPDASGNCPDYLSLAYSKAFSGESELRDHEILCGNKTPHNYYFSESNLLLTFKTNAEIERSGFQATLRHAKACNVTYTALNGRIVKEVGSTDCEIHFDLPQNYTISFYFPYYFPSNGNCSEFYIKFYDDTSNELLKTICRHVDSAFINSNKVRMHLLLKYVTDWDMTYMGNNKVLGCGGEFHQSYGILTSPLYPSNVANYTNCRWDIRLPQDYKIKLAFRHFDMGSTATCPYNYIKIFEITSGAEKEVRKFCGDVQPAPYISERNELAIVYNKTLNFDGTGWVIYYSKDRT